jgi:MSHA biogenesis protein MshN
VSLINKMLRDLDERHATTLERGGLAAQVRALPQEKHFPWASVIPVVLGVVVGAAGLWFTLAAPSPISNAVSAPATQPLSAPVAALALPPLVVPMPSESPAEPPVAETPKAPATESLQMDFKLSRAPARAEPTPPATPPVTAPAPAASPVPVAAPGPAAQIDKRPLTPPVDTAEGDYRKALAAYRQGRPNEALEGFQAALRIDARHVSARQALLSQLMEQRRWPEARTVVADGLAAVPAQPGWAMILARLQVEQGQVAEAEQTMATYAAHGARSPEYQAFHGLLLEKLQRPEEARVAFTKARGIGSLPPELAAAVEQRLR